MAARSQLMTHRVSSHAPGNTRVDSTNTARQTGCVGRRDGSVLIMTKGGSDMVMQTLPLGELALLEDLITREQLLSTLNYQAERREASRPDRKLGTLLVHQGY